MFAKGIYLSLKLGSRGQEPAPQSMLEALQAIEVTHDDEERSGFQVVLQAGRSGAASRTDDPFLADQRLKPGERIIIGVVFNGSPYILMDGLISHQQFSPSFTPGESTFTLTGEDVSLAMDRNEKPEQHPAQDEKVIIEQLLQKYSQYGLKLTIEKPPLKAPAQQERIPVKLGTDLEYIQDLARQHGYVFYITPGPNAGQNSVYWGPPQPLNRQEPQKALTVNMGAYTNVESLDFQHNALAPTQVLGRFQDRDSNRLESLNLAQSTRPPLAKASPFYPTLARRSYSRESGHSRQRATILAQAQVNRSIDQAVRVSGELDTVRYGGLLEVRKLIGLRGVGFHYDGIYYVKQVSHSLRPGEYKQKFTLTREGLESTVEQLPI